METAMTRALQVDPADNVAIVFSAVGFGDAVDCGPTSVTATGSVPAGHKLALVPIPKDGLIVKYGVPIGRASVAIQVGEHVHCHNTIDITEELCRAAG